MRNKTINTTLIDEMNKRLSDNEDYDDRPKTCISKYFQCFSVKKRADSEDILPSWGTNKETYGSAKKYNKESSFYT